MEKNNIDIENIVKNRLRLQTVQRNFFNNLGILFPTLEKFKQDKFLHQYNQWELEQKNKFLIELGGQANLQQTKRWIDKLIKEKLEPKKKHEALTRIHN